MGLGKFEQQFLKKKINLCCYLETGHKKFPLISYNSLVEIHTRHCIESYNFVYKILQTQLEENYCLWIDADHMTDFKHFDNTSNLLICQPNSPEECLNILTKPLLECLSIVVIASVANLLPLEGGYTKLEAQLSNIRKILPKTCSIIFINPFNNNYNIFAKYMDIVIKLDKYKGKVIKNIKTLKLYSFNHNQ